MQRNYDQTIYCRSKIYLPVCLDIFHPFHSHQHDQIFYLPVTCTVLTTRVPQWIFSSGGKISLHLKKDSPWTVSIPFRTCRKFFCYCSHFILNQNPYQDSATSIQEISPFWHHLRPDLNSHLISDFLGM